MSQENRVSIKISPADMKKVLDAVKVVQDVLKPYLISLSPEERQTIPKANDKTMPFVQKTLEYCKSNPDFVPVYVDVKELGVDLQAASDLTQILRPVEQLYSGLDDTTMLSSSEAYVAALAYYNSVKHAAKMNVPNAKPIYDDLKKRFPGRPPKD